MVARHVVSTSRTPGHTKYYQHIPITKEVRLMDCPGLGASALFLQWIQCGVDYFAMLVF
jgi:ribosome biogenesis GTPase A